MILPFLSLFLVYCTADSSFSLTIFRGKVDRFIKAGNSCRDCYKSNANCQNKTWSSDGNDRVCRCNASPSTYVFGKESPLCYADKDLLNPRTDNSSCLSWHSKLVEIVDLSTPSLSKSFSMKPYICYLPINNSFEYQLLDGTWKTRNLTRNIFALRGQNQLQINGSPDLQTEFEGHLIRVILNCTKIIIKPDIVGMKTTHISEEKCLLFKVTGHFVYPKPSPPSPTPTKTASQTLTESFYKETVPTVHLSSSAETNSQPSAMGSRIQFAPSKDTKVMTSVIATVGAIVCLLIICVFAWLYLRHFNKQRLSLNGGNINVRKSLPPLPATSIPRRMRRSLPQEDHIYCELSEIAQIVSVRRRTSLSETGSEMSSVPASNNISSYTNKGMETESQDELDQYIKVDMVPESVNCDKGGPLESEKSHYQSLKGSDNSCFSVYETLVREYQNINVLGSEEICSNTGFHVGPDDSPLNLTEEKQSKAHESSHVEPDRSGERAAHELKETELNDAPKYFILERPCPFGVEKQEIHIECSEEETNGHCYYVLEGPCTDNPDQTLGASLSVLNDGEIQPKKIDNNSDIMAVEIASVCVDKVKFSQNECAHYHPEAHHEQDETDDFEVK